MNLYPTNPDWKCKNCVFFLKEYDVCRRYPPKPMEDGDTVFPFVNEENACGEFKKVSWWDKPFVENK